MPEGPVNEILRQVRALSLPQRIELVQAIRMLDDNPLPPPVSVLGKMAHLPTSSEDFIRRKFEDIDLEERRYRR